MTKKAKNYDFMVKLRNKHKSLTAVFLPAAVLRLYNCKINSIVNRSGTERIKLGICKKNGTNQS